MLGRTEMDIKKAVDFYILIRKLPRDYFKIILHFLTLIRPLPPHMLHLR